MERWGSRRRSRPKVYPFINPNSEVDQALHQALPLAPRTTPPLPALLHFHGRGSDSRAVPLHSLLSSRIEFDMNPNPGAGRCRKWQGQRGAGGTNCARFHTPSLSYSRSWQLWDRWGVAPCAPSWSISTRGCGQRRRAEDSPPYLRKRVKACFWHISLIRVNSCNSCLSLCLDNGVQRHAGGGRARHSVRAVPGLR